MRVREGAKLQHIGQCIMRNTRSWINWPKASKVDNQFLLITIATSSASRDYNYGEAIAVVDGTKGEAWH